MTSRATVAQGWHYVTAGTWAIIDQALATGSNFFNRPGFGIASQTLGFGFSGGGAGGGQNALYNMGSNRSGQLTLKLSF